MEAAIDTPPDDPNEIDLTYPIYDRVTDFLTTPNANSFDLQDPASIQRISNTIPTPNNTS